MRTLIGSSRSAEDGIPIDLHVLNITSDTPDVDQIRSQTNKTEARHSRNEDRMAGTGPLQYSVRRLDLRKGSGRVTRIRAITGKSLFPLRQRSTGEYLATIHEQFCYSLQVQCQKPT